MHREKKEDSDVVSQAIADTIAEELKRKLDRCGKNSCLDRHWFWCHDRPELDAMMQPSSMLITTRRSTIPQFVRATLILAHQVRQALAHQPVLDERQTARLVGAKRNIDFELLKG